MYLRHILIGILPLLLISCNSIPEQGYNKYSIGIISNNNSNSLDKYDEFKKYFAIQTQSLIEFEPAFNEIKALEQIAGKKWDLVFAPPGLAAIAISEYNYQAIMPLEGRDKTRSVIVVKNDSLFQTRKDLAGKKIALGQKGSATGYYFPLYNLYGLNISKIQAPTPKKVLQWLDNKEVNAGALSLEEYNLYRRQFPPNSFRILYLDQHNVPSGAILISDHIERNQEGQIIIALTRTPSFVSASAGFLTTEKLPDYSYLINVIKRVREISPNHSKGTSGKI